MFNAPQYDEDERFSIPSPIITEADAPDDEIPMGWTRRRVIVALVAVIVIIALLAMYLSPIIQAWRIQDMLIPFSPIFEPQMKA
jgi:hypothetical protein